MGRPLDVMTFTVTRRPGSWATGAWVPSSTSTVNLDASRPQPVGPEIIEMLPEGARTTARMIIYAEDSEPEIYLVGRAREGYAADTIAYDGNEYLVTTVDDYNGMPLGYHGYILLAYGPDETP